jgi:4-amino-4-deoxy-L-arabinose transferase-like glycosyltransferase
MSHAASPSAWGSTERSSSERAAQQLSGEPSAPRAGVLPRSPHERLLLAGIVLLAASMYGWEAAHAEYHGFYAVAARSMTTGWRAFVFGALDPNASITIDKIPGFLWPQALSALLFGFHPWALALPQAAEGVVTVLALNSAVRRWIGPGAGLLAAGILALTPVAASLFGKVLEDAALTCLLVLAAAAWQRAVERGALRWLLLCGFWVGLAFQAKMLQSWAVLPAFALAYLIAAPPRLRTRLWHALAAGAVCVSVSLSWVLVATLTPAGDRPYIDGSTDNSAFAMVFGYNGLARFGAVGVSAAGTGSVAATQGTHFGASGTTGWFKLFEHDLASQVGWLYPVAAAGIAFGLWRRGRGRTDRVRAGTLMWTGWLLTTGLALSAGSVPHSTYVVALAPPLAALSAYALVRVVDLHRRSESRAQRLALPALTAVTLAWAVRLSSDFPHFVPGIALPLAALTSCVVVVTVVLRRVAGRRAGITAWTAAASCALMLAVPALWSLSVFDSAYAGSSGNANAGGYVGGYGGFHFPRGMAAAGGAGRSIAGVALGAARAAHSMNGANALGAHGSGAGAVAAGAPGATPPRFNPFNPPATLDPAESRLLSYLDAHRDGARYLLATESWSTASPYILTEVAPVLPMGGFSGSADFPQPRQFSALVAAGQLHYVLLTGRGMHGFGQHPQGAGGPDAAQLAQTGFGGPAPVTDVTRIAAQVTKNCQLVPADAYGAVPQETAPLYYCR